MPLWRSMKITQIMELIYLLAAKLSTQSFRSNSIRSILFNIVSHNDNYTRNRRIPVGFKFLSFSSLSHLWKHHTLCNIDKIHNGNFCPLSSCVVCRVNFSMVLLLTYYVQNKSLSPVSLFAHMSTSIRFKSTLEISFQWLL